MRKTLLLLVFILVVISGVTAAQTFPPTFCGDLSEADCAILTDSAAAMRELESAAFTFQLDFEVGNLPEPEMKTVSFRMTGDGAYALDPAALTALTLSPAAITELMQNMDMDQLPQLMEHLLTAISADATLVLYLPQNLPDMDEPLPERVGLSMRLVDGVAYINLDKLAELDPSGDIPEGWIGIDLVELVNQAMAAQSDILNEMPDMSMNMDMFSAFADPEFLSSYMTVTRGADTTVDGQTAAVFETQIDLDALFSSEAFQDMMRQQIETMTETMGEGSGLSSSDFEDVMTLYSTLFDGLVVESTQTIGLDDHYVHAATATMDWALDFGAMAAGFGGMSDESIPTITLNIDFQGGLSQFNSAPEITAPEDATIVPLENLFGMSGF